MISGSFKMLMAVTEIYLFLCWELGWKNTTSYMGHILLAEISSLKLLLGLSVGHGHSYSTGQGIP
jgi:hypothetical protein